MGSQGGGAGAIGEPADEATLFQRGDQPVDAGFGPEIERRLHFLERSERRRVAGTGSYRSGNVMLPRGTPLILGRYETVTVPSLARRRSVVNA